MRVAIVGATGMLGKPVAEEFILTGFSVRLIGRDLDKLTALFPGEEIVYGDLRDVSSLTDALQGIDVVYLNLSVKQSERKSGFHTEAEGLQNLITAVRVAGVRRIGYLSSLIMRYQGMYGFNWWVFDLKQRAVQLIKESGIPYSLFYPSCFMESLNSTQRLERFILLVGRSVVKPWYVSANDYGKQVVQAFRIAADGENQEYTIQGPEAMTQHEAAERFVAAYKSEKLSVLTTPSFLVKLGSAFSPRAAYGWHITEALNKYPEAFEAEQTWADLGKPQTTVEQFAKQF